jgi:hypothetical protein
VGRLKALYEGGTDSTRSLGRRTVNGTGGMAKSSRHFIIGRPAPRDRIISDWHIDGHHTG